MTDVTVAAMEYLEDSIDRRIVALEEINSHYLNLRSKLGKRHEKTAFDVVTTSSMSGVNKPLDTTSKTSTSDSEANDCQDGFSPALSKILNQAREIRNAPKVKAKRDSSAIRAIDGAKSTKTSIKGDFDNGLTNDPANSIPVCSKIPDEDIKYHQKSKLIADLRLCGQHKSCPLSCLGGTSSELFVSESKFLSQVSGRTVLPSSVPFELLNDAPYGVDVNARKMKIDEPIVGAMCAKLLISVKQHRLAYNRTLKSRISRIGFSNFSKDDIAEVIESWYRIRKYNMIYDEIHNVFESSASMDNDSDASSDHSQSAESKPHAEFPPTDEQLILRDVDALPLCTPIFIRGRISASRANFSSVGNKRWQQIHLQRVNIFNLTFQTRVKYAVESLIGKHQLKRVVAALKLCCAESMATTDASSKEVHRCQWVRALSLFREVYCCLTSETQNYSSSMFIEKSCPP